MLKLRTVISQNKRASASNQHPNFRGEKRGYFSGGGQDPQKVISLDRFVHKNTRFSWFHSFFEGWGWVGKLGAKQNGSKFSRAPPPRGHWQIVLLG